MGKTKSRTIISDDLDFSDIFDLEHLQHVQDLFSEAMDVATVIVYPSGLKITKPSNYDQCFNEIISDFLTGDLDFIAGIWSAMAQLTVGDQLAYWFIGEVHPEKMDELQLNLHDRQFEKKERMLHALASELSEKAVLNLQIKQQIEDLGKAELHVPLPTEGKVPEGILQNERLLLRTLIDNIPDSIYSKDVLCRKTLANRAEVRFMGAGSEDEVLGKTDFDFYPEELAAKFFIDDQSVIQSGQPVLNREEYIFDENGEKRWLLSSKLPLRDKDNQIIGLVGIGRDITERKKVEEKLVQAEAKTMESTVLKTAFLTNIAHEIRIPFSGILGYLSFLQNEGLTGSEREEDITILNENSKRLMNTISDIVEISQIQTGQMKVSVSKTSIEGLIESITDRFKPEAEHKGLEFIVNNRLPEHLKNIFTDSEKLTSILSNLIGNAVKFTQSGVIELNIRPGSADETAGSGDAVGKPVTLEFFIKDTGIGIPESKLNTIFDTFTQADVSNTRKFEGSGLGLSIAKAYVEMLGGTISVDSREGQGSAFHFTICGNTESEQPSEPGKTDKEDADDTHVKSLKILIAEDDEGSAYHITMAVKRFGKEVIRVKTGLEAVEACRNNADIDLIMMDIKMPEMDGDEATRQIRKFNTDVVIIAQTAYAMLVDRKMVMDAGCNDYITKPIKKDNLVVLVNNYFKKQQNESR